METYEYYATDSEVVKIAALISVNKFNTIAGLSWLLYDCFLSFSDEVQLIWRSAASIPKVLYFISRYFGIFAQVLGLIPLQCLQGLVLSSVTIFIVAVSVELSLALRVYALYSGSRIILAILLVTAIVQISTTVVIDVLADIIVYPQVLPLPSKWPIRGCSYPASPSFERVNWIPVLGLETIVFILMCIKCYSYRPLHDVPLLLRIWRDGAAYYFVIFAVLFVYTLSQYVTAFAPAAMLAWWVVPIYSYSGSHLLLSVRALAAERQRLEMMIPQISETISDFEAAELSNMGFQEDSWEVYELSTPPRDPTACLHRDGVVLRTQRRSGSWMQHWDARPARSMTAY